MLTAFFFSVATWKQKPERQMTRTYQMQSAFINKCYSFSILCSLSAYQLALMLCGFILSQQYPKQAGIYSPPRQHQAGTFLSAFLSEEKPNALQQAPPKGHPGFHKFFCFTSA